MSKEKKIQSVDMTFSETEKQFHFSHSNKEKFYNNIKDFPSLINFFNFMNRKQTDFTDSMVREYLEKKDFKELTKENKDVIEQMPDHIKEDEEMTKEIFFMLYKAMLMDTYFTKSRVKENPKNILKSILADIFEDLTED